MKQLRWKIVECETHEVILLIHEDGLECAFHIGSIFNEDDDYEYEGPIQFSLNAEEYMDLLKLLRNPTKKEALLNMRHPLLQVVTPYILDDDCEIIHDK